MKRLIPTRTQWNNWSLPSKLGAIGTLVGLISLLLSLYPVLIPSNKAFEKEEALAALEKNLSKLKYSLEVKNKIIASQRESIEIFLNKRNENEKYGEILKYLSNGNIKEAVSTLDHQIDLEKSKSARELSDLFAYKGNLLQSVNGDLALTAYRDAINLHPDNLEAWKGVLRTSEYCEHYFDCFLNSNERILFLSQSSPPERVIGYWQLYTLRNLLSEKRRKGITNKIFEHMINDHHVLNLIHGRGFSYKEIYKKYIKTAGKQKFFLHLIQTMESDGDFKRLENMYEQALLLHQQS